MPTMGNLELELVQGDITNQSDLDAVVNAANGELTIGGGVAGAIHLAAGPELDKACRPLAPIRSGQAVITDAFGLPNQRIIHCLGPVYGADEPADAFLADCYRNSLALADGEKLSSIGFPAISTGAFGYPMEAAAEVAFRTIREQADRLNHVRRVRFVLFSNRDRDRHAAVLEGLH